MLGLPTENGLECSDVDDQDAHYGLLHVYPTWGRPHKLSVDCWCRPSLDWGDGVGDPVVVHEVHH